LRTLKICLEDDPFDSRPIRERYKGKEKVTKSKKRHQDKVDLNEVKKSKKAKKLQRHQDKVDLNEWKIQDSDRQARLGNYGSVENTA